MAAQRYAYTGWEQKTYGSYLARSESGEVATLVGTPGMNPVVILCASGNEMLPEVPADGMWAPAEPETPAKPARKQATSTQADAPASA